MELPPFPEKRPKGRIKGVKVNKKEREGEILFDHKNERFYIEKEDENYGYYKTMTEAYYVKKVLMENNWDKECLKSTLIKRIQLNK